MGENMLHVSMSFLKQKQAKEEGRRYFTSGNISSKIPVYARDRQTFTGSPFRGFWGQYLCFVASLFLQGAIGLLNQIKKCGCHEEYSWEAQQHQQEIGMSFFFFPFLKSKMLFQLHQSALLKAEFRKLGSARDKNTDLAGQVFH